MSEHDASLTARPASGAEGVLRPGEVLLRAFNDSRDELISSLWFFLGVQIVFSSFFISMLGISRGTYIGDYDIKKH